MKRNATKKSLVVLMSCSMAVSNMIPMAALAKDMEPSDQKATATNELGVKANGLTNFSGADISVEGDSVKLNKIAKDNFSIFDGLKQSTNDFHYSADVIITAGGMNNATLVFGIGNKNIPKDLWKGANVVKEDKDTTDVMRVFKVPNGEDYGERQALKEYDASKKVHMDLDVKEDGTYVYTVQSEGGTLNTQKGKINDWNGGYIGLLTYNTEAKFSNIQFEDRTAKQEGEFDTNLNNLRGLGGQWQIKGDGFNSKGNGDNFATSSTKGSNFEYTANITNEIKNGAGAITFRAQDENNPRNGCYVVNVDYRNNIIKLFSFPSGGTIKQVPLSSVEPKADGSYDIKVVAVGEDIYVYANGEGVIRAKDNKFKEGYFGLLTWESTVTYRNLYTKAVSELPVVKDAELQDFEILTKGVTMTPKFDKTVRTYGMDIPSGISKVTLKPKSNGNTYYSLRDRDGNVVVKKTKIDGTFELDMKDFKNNFMKMSLIVEKDGFSESVEFFVNQWLSLDELANDPNRAQFHVSPQVNFMNDPNGMVYDSTDGYWHLFYQISSKMGFNEQAWAHVRSKDLVNWEQQPLGLQIDEKGLIFSGSAVEDKDNSSGFFTDNVAGESKLVHIYTYHNTQNGQQSQAIAYSKDHGKTWVKYDKNPVVPNSESISGNDFRDPKVFKIDGDDKWYMVTAGGAAQIHTSKDLKTWTKSQALKYQNGDQIHSECPGLIRAKVNGTGETKWIYNGSAGFYIVGRMEKQGDTYKWIAESEKMDVDSNGNPWGGFGKYATMTFFQDGTGKGREIGISWIQDFTGFTGKTYMGTQSLPQEYGLKQDANGKYIVTSNPVEEVKQLRDMKNILYTTKNKKVESTDKNILSGVSGIRYDLEGTFTLGTAKEFGFKLRKGNGKELVYKYNVADKKMYVNGGNAGPNQNGGNFSYRLTPLAGNKVKLRIIVDQGVVEAFGNDGEANISTTLYQNNDNIGMEFYSVDGNVTIDSLNIYDMKSMYSGKSGSESTVINLVFSVPSIIETGKEFTIETNTYPNLGKDQKLEWTYDKGLTLVRKDNGTITLKAAKEGTYKVKATGKNGLKKEIDIKVIKPIFDTNLINWKAISGSWNKSESGINGDNAGLGDAFYMTDTKLKKGVPFTYEADIHLEEGTAVGMVFGVNDRNNPNSNWLCVNIEKGEQNVAKLFKNTGAQDWSQERKLTAEEIARKDYHFKLVYDGTSMEYFLDDSLVAKIENANFEGGYVGLNTFKSNASFNNVVLTTDAPITSIVSNFEDINVFEGSTIDSLKAKLPTSAVVEKEDGVQLSTPIVWNTSVLDLNKVGDYTLSGTIAGTQLKATTKVSVKEVTLVSLDPSSLAITAKAGTSATDIFKALKKEVTGVYSDGSRKNLLVNGWDVSKVNFNKPGTYTVNGMIDGTDMGIKIKITITKKDAPVADSHKVTNKDKTISVTGKFPTDISLVTNYLNVNDVAKSLKDKTYLNTRVLESVIDFSLLQNGKQYVTTGEMSVSIDMKAEWKGKKLSVISIDEAGNIVNIEYVVKDGKITFKTTHLSRIAIVSEKKTTSGGVNTGDQTNVSGLITLLAGTGLGALYLRRKGKKIKE